jgi:phosphoribosylanthranilate isomerase
MTRIKICGNTEPVGVRTAIDLGVDLLGFIFSPSPREVAVETAAALLALVPSNVETVGVFVNESTDVIAAVLERCPLRAIQLYRPATPADHELGAEVIQVLRMPNDLPSLIRQTAGDRVLLDTFQAGFAGGGSGRTWDWRLPDGLPAGVRVIASGGLRPANVGEAITSLRPWGVDVASGVEREPGIKDPEKLAKFVDAVRRADATLAVSA